MDFRGVGNDVVSPSSASAGGVSTSVAMT